MGAVVVRNVVVLVRRVVLDLCESVQVVSAGIGVVVVVDEVAIREGVTGNSARTMASSTSARCASTRMRHRSHSARLALNMSRALVTSGCDPVNRFSDLPKSSISRRTFVSTFARTPRATAGLRSHSFESGAIAREFRNLVAIDVSSSLRASEMSLLASTRPCRTLKATVEFTWTSSMISNTRLMSQAISRGSIPAGLPPAAGTWPRTPLAAASV